ncbi:MAG TPA: ABC transporter substrate-binding protein, partial [Thermoleophilaceae bacterium]|nr:ABC transporter substrate-binding protein [Thermoleophilaceae bacterium]
MRKLACLAALALALAPAGCGEKEDALEPSGSKGVQLMLDYFPNADHAGIYAAQAAGHFEQAGLDVTIRQPPDPAAPIKQVAAGRVDLAISYEPEVLRARDLGLNVVSVAAIVQKPLTSIISLPEGKVRTPADLRGKTVGTAGIDYQSAYLSTILTDAGVPENSVKERNVGFAFSPALITGKIDAALGAFWNYEGTELRLRDKRPRIIRMEDAGVPTYNELVLVANEDALERDASKIRAFIGAVSRGTRDLRADPDDAIDGLLEANPDLDPELQRAVVKITLPL